MKQQQEIEKSTALFVEFEGQYGVIPYKSYDEVKQGYNLGLSPCISRCAMLSAVLVVRAEIAKNGGEDMQENLAFLDMLLARYKGEGIRVVTIAAPDVDAPKGGLSFEVWPFLLRRPG